MANNRVIIGHVWEAVEDEPKHFYEILSEGEIVHLRRVCDNGRTTRFIGQISGFGRVRPMRKGEEEKKVRRLFRK